MSSDATFNGSSIAALRKRLNMTQEEFAHAIGVTVSTVNRWENGHITPSRLARRAMESLLQQAIQASNASQPPGGANGRAIDDEEKNIGA
jgi:DNA-binding transcriptional regulator YiaG